MPVLKLYLNGVTMGIAPRKNDHERAKRGDVMGWSKDAARRNLAFLRSIKVDALTGYAYTLTLTLRDCPSNAEAWHRCRRAFIERLRRMGMIRMHWVTEWQTRGVPHLHGMVYFSEPQSRRKLIDHWLAVAAPYRAGIKGQDVKDVSNVLGWCKYLAKHASRGYQHYQRAAGNIPSGWVKTGRVWGHLGDWPIKAPTRYDFGEPAFYRLRRIVRGWAVANSREPVLAKVGSSVVFVVDWRRVNVVKRMLRCGDSVKSRSRGVSEWLPGDAGEVLIDWMRGEGYPIRSDVEEVATVRVGDMAVDPETGEILDGSEEPPNEPDGR